MSGSLQLGPLALPWALLALWGSWWLGSSLQERLAQRQRLAPGPHGWALMACALVAARLGFVFTYWSSYVAYVGATPGSPASSAWGQVLPGLLRVLDIRDGGWSPWWGLAAACAYVAVLWLRRSPWARSVTLGLLAGASLWLGVLAAQHWSRPAASPLPDWQGLALDGSTVSLPALTGLPGPPGQVVVVNLWASWCPPCRREMPAMLQAQAAHPEVRFLWVNQGEAPEVVLRFARQQGLPLAQVLLDPESALGLQLGQRALPTTWFYRADGRLAAVRTGEVSSATLAHYLQRAQAAPP